MTRRHILVTGGLRSGTTWVGRTIAHDRSIEYLHEPFNASVQARDCRYRFETWFFYAPGSPEEEKVYRELDRLFKTRTHPFHRAVFESRKSSFGLTTPYRFARHVVLQTVAQKRGLMKDPVALMSAAWLSERFNMHVICMIRSPLAFAGSFKRWGWNFDFDHLRRQPRLMAEHFNALAPEIDRLASTRVEPVEQACLLWNVFHTVILDYRERYPDWLFLRHEDLATNPEQEFERVFAFLGLRFSDEIRSRITAFTSSALAAEAPDWRLAPRDSRGSLDTWRQRLTASEIRLVCDRTDQLATRFYRFDGAAFV
jgi:hypothetical protein